MIQIYLFVYENSYDIFRLFYVEASVVVEVQGDNWIDSLHRNVVYNSRLCVLTFIIN